MYHTCVPQDQHFVEYSWNLVGNLQQVFMVCKSTFSVNINDNQMCHSYMITIHIVVLKLSCERQG